MYRSFFFYWHEHCQHVVWVESYKIVYRLTMSIIVNLHQFVSESKTLQEVEILLPIYLHVHDWPA